MATIIGYVTFILFYSHSTKIFVAFILINILFMVYSIWYFFFFTKK